jgi:hypothetical protein
MNQIPEADFLKLVQISGNPDATPPVPVIILFSQDDWHASVKPGRYPAPVYLHRLRSRRVLSRRGPLRADSLRRSVLMITTSIRPPIRAIAQGRI